MVKTLSPTEKLLDVYNKINRNLAIVRSDDDRRDPNVIYPYRLKSSVVDLSVLSLRDDEQKEDFGFNRAQRPDQTAQDGAGWPCSGPDQGRVING